MPTVPEHELVIRITAPTAENGEHWSTTIRDLVTAEYGDSMRLAFDGPRLVGPAGADLLAGAEVTDAAEEPPVAQPGLCGLPHYDYPESTCSEPAGHADGPRPTCHGAVLVIGGEERGEVAWGPEVSPDA